MLSSTVARASQRMVVRTTHTAAAPRAFRLPWIMIAGAGVTFSATLLFRDALTENNLAVNQQEAPTERRFPMLAFMTWGANVYVERRF